MANEMNDVEIVAAPADEATLKRPAPKASGKKKVVETAEPPVRKKIVPVDRNDLVEVRSCVYGELNYISYGTGNKITWQTFGDTNWITVADLMEMRNGAHRHVAAVLQHLRVEAGVHGALGRGEEKWRYAQRQHWLKHIQAGP